eukprot:12319267-Heterocapsa_arctica.AAC.1
MARRSPAAASRYLASSCCSEVVVLTDTRLRAWARSLALTMRRSVCRWVRGREESGGGIHLRPSG